MKKAIDQTVRDIKRGVNKKVLKVPSIEQKVLDATSNEPWGPHGSLLAEIAHATRNYHEYQIIMAVIWKRINDTGKNWRHVYKALTVLEYLVAHGSERVIDDIREHAYQISTLSDFQYIDSSGKDQGSNVRKKSQSLVVLVNDKERLQEVRQKAAANRDKYRSTSAGSMYRPGSGGYGDRYDDGRYGNQDDDRNGYGRDREWGSRDDDKYGQYGDSYGHEGERYGRDYEERYSRDGYRGDDYRGRSQNNDDYSYSSRGADRDRNSANEDDSQHSSRVSVAKGDDRPQDGSTMGERVDHKHTGQNPGAPPSYDDAVDAGRSPSYNDREREYSQPNAFQESVEGHTITTATPTPALDSEFTPAPISVSAPTTVPGPTSVVQHSYQGVDGFDEFDPRGSFSAAPPTSGAAPAAAGMEMDLLGSLSDSFTPNSFSVPASQPTTTTEANGTSSFNSGATNGAPPTASPAGNQSFDDPFGDGPFKALPSTNTESVQSQFSAVTNSFNTNLSQTVDVPQPAPPNPTTEFGGTFNDTSYMTSGSYGVQQPTSIQFPNQELSAPNQEIDILADILPPSEPSSSINAQAGYPVPHGQSMSHNGFPHQNHQLEPRAELSSLTGQDALQNNFHSQTGQPAGFPPQNGQPSPHMGYFPSAESGSQTGFPPQVMPSNSLFQAGQAPQLGIHSQGGSMQPNMPNPNFYGAYSSQSLSTHAASGYMVPPGSTASLTQNNFPSQSSIGVPFSSQISAQAPQVQSSGLMDPLSSNSSSAGFAPAAVAQPSKDKFETKSTVWADTLSRGLVDLNISGPKANPLADIGVDFDSINRKEKRMEKQAPSSTVASTVTMGKAMGSGSGMGRAGASALRAPPTPMMRPGMNMGMPGGPGAGFGMQGYGGINQPVGRGMGMGVGTNLPGSMGMGQGMNMQQPMGYPAMSGGYNHMAGPGYNQHPQGGGYR